MYRKYYNEYERRADEIRRAAEALEKQPEPQKPVVPVPIKPPPGQKKTGLPFLDNIFDKFAVDDIILAVLILILLQEKDSDKLLVLILGFLFISGF